MKSKWLYVVHTLDKYELPLFVSDNIHEVAKFSGRTESSIKSLISKERHGKIKRCRFKCIHI